MPAVTTIRAVRTTADRVSLRRMERRSRSPSGSKWRTPRVTAGHSRCSRPALLRAAEHAVDVAVDEEPVERDAAAVEVAGVPHHGDLGHVAVDRPEERLVQRVVAE